jgi:hypothetical protein
VEGEVRQALTTAHAHDGRVFRVGERFRLDIAHRNGGTLIDDLVGHRCRLVGIVDANIGVLRFDGEVECRLYEFRYLVDETTWVSHSTIQPR